MPSEKSRFIQRCVADVTAQGKELKGAFAICTAQSQKAGYSKPGSAKMTGKGAAREKAFKNADDMKAKSAEYERAVQAGRQEEISMRSLIRQLEEASGADEDLLPVITDKHFPKGWTSQAYKKTGEELLRQFSGKKSTELFAHMAKDPRYGLLKNKEDKRAFMDNFLKAMQSDHPQHMALYIGAADENMDRPFKRQFAEKHGVDYDPDVPGHDRKLKSIKKQMLSSAGGGATGADQAPEKKGERPSWDEVARKAAAVDGAQKERNAGDFKATSDGKAEVPGPEGQVDGEWRTVRGKRVFFPSDPGDEVPEGPWGGAPWRPGWDKQGRFREPKTDRPQKGQLSLFGKHESMESLFQSIEEGVDEEAGASKAIADEILRQLGGRRFLVMTGARNLMSFDKLDDERKWPGLQVQFPQGKAKYMRIALAPSDTYTIQFMTRTGKVAKEMDDIYVDVLQRVVSDYTGLALSL